MCAEGVGRDINSESEVALRTTIIRCCVVARGFAARGYVPLATSPMFRCVEMDEIIDSWMRQNASPTRLESILSELKNIAIEHDVGSASEFETVGVDAASRHAATQRSEDGFSSKARLLQSVKSMLAELAHMQRVGGPGELSVLRSLGKLVGSLGELKALKLPVKNRIRRWE